MNLDHLLQSIGVQWNLELGGAVEIERKASPLGRSKMSIGAGISESERAERDEQLQGGESESDSILGIPQIAIDLFVVTKKNRRRLHFTDSFGNLVYTAADAHHSSRVLFDPSANPLISVFRSPDGSWEGFKGDGCGQEFLFRVDQTLDTFSKLEFNIFLTREHGGDLPFQMRGCLFWRSCTIYQDKSIVAQTNLMYKLGFRKYFVRRSIFRVTVFPGFADYNFIAALLLIFLDGRKG